MGEDVFSNNRGHNAVSGEQRAHVDMEDSRNAVLAPQFCVPAAALRLLHHLLEGHCFMFSQTKSIPAIVGGAELWH